MDSKSLSFFQTRTLGAAYKLANRCAHSGAKILELFPIGSSGHLIVESGDVALIKKISSEFESGIINETFIPKVSVATFRAYLSQQNAAVKKNLLIIECEFIGNCFFAAEILLKNHCELVDLRLFRGQDKYSLLMGTTESLEIAEVVKSLLQSEDLTCTLITDAHREIAY